MFLDLISHSNMAMDNSHHPAHFRIHEDNLLGGFCLIESSMTDIHVEEGWTSLSPHSNKYIKLSACPLLEGVCLYCGEKASFHLSRKGLLCEEHGNMALLELAMKGYYVPDLAHYREEQARLYDHFFSKDCVV